MFGSFLSKAAKAFSPDSLSALRGRPLDQALGDTGIPVLDAFIRDTEIPGSRHFDPIETRFAQAAPLLSAAPDVQGDAFARLMILDARIDAVLRAQTREFSSIKVHLGLMLSALMHRNEATMSSADAAQAIDEAYAALRSADILASRYFGREDRLSFILESVARCAEPTQHRQYPVALAAVFGLIDSVVEKRVPPLGTEGMVKWQRKIAAILGKAEGSSRLLALDARAKQTADAIRPEIYATAGETLGPFLDGSHDPSIPRHESTRTGHAAKRMIEALSTEERGDAILRIFRLSKLVAPLQKLKGRPRHRDPWPASLGHLPEVSAISTLEDTIGAITRRPAKFSPDSARELIGLMGGFHCLAFARNLARALSPDMPGAREAVESLIAGWNDRSSDARKAAKILRDAVAPEAEPAAMGADPDTERRTALTRLDEAIRALKEAANEASDHEGQMKNLTASALGALTDEARRYSVFRLTGGAGASLERLGKPIDSALVALLQAAKLGDLPREHVDYCNRIAEFAESYQAEFRELSPGNPEGHYLYNAAGQTLRMIGSALGRVAIYTEMTEPQRSAMAKIEAFAMDAPTSGKPSKGWRNAAHSLLTDVERKPAIEALILFLKSAEPRTLGSWNVSDSDSLAQRPIPALIWMAADWDATEVARPVADFALRCFSSEAGSGIKAEKAGNACLWALSELPEGAGASHLARIAARVRFPKVKKKIDAALNTAAGAAGLDRAELDELIVPDHGFVEGRRVFGTGHGSAEIELDGRGKAALAWKTADGKAVKSPPKALKENAPETIKQARALLKEVEADLSVQIRRIERLPLQNRRIPAEHFHSRYVDHALIALLCRSLIWQVDGQAGIWRDGRLETIEGVEIPLSGDVSFWHPVETTSETVLAWRDRLEALGIMQPIRQAWREVYVVTDAERATGTYSNRFAGHILRQHQSMALARANGWSCTHRMWVDAPNDEPTWIAFPAHGVLAEYWTEGAGGEDPEVLDSGAYIFLGTDRVAFYRVNQTAASNTHHALRGVPMRVEDVPPVVFSEIMRNCDLFVSVASIAADPLWADRGADAEHPNQWRRDARDYWDRATAGALSGGATVRREALERILPRLKIADRVTLAERHVEVQGTRRRYRIHIGSAAVQREPDGRHVCIVPKGTEAKRADRIDLPFEGDTTLSLVLSKALMLAEDNKITDPVILRQI